jgi:hypothetical protein
MAERYFGTLDITWERSSMASEDIPAELIEAASRLTLRDYESQGFSNLKSGMHVSRTLTGKMEVYLNRLFPSRKEIASRYPIPADSFRVFFWYPVWWAYVFQRVWRNMTRHDKSVLGEEADNLVRVQSWLKD